MGSLVAGIVTLLAALLVWLLTRRSAHHLQHLQGQLQPVDLQDLKKPLVWLLSACFFFYSCQFTSVTSFLPSLMISTSSWHIETASLFTAMVIMSNAVGSIVAGALLRRGFGFCPILVAGALGMGISAYILFNADMPLLVRLTSAFGFSMVGGLLPGALFATLPQTATSPAIVGMLIGLMLQASGVGQLIGGVALPAVVEYFHSWQAAGILALAYSIAGSVAAASTNCFSAKHTRKE